MAGRWGVGSPSPTKLLWRLAEVVQSKRRPNAEPDQRATLSRSTKVAAKQTSKEFKKKRNFDSKTLKHLRLKNLDDSVDWKTSYILKRKTVRSPQNAQHSKTSWNQKQTQTSSMHKQLLFMICVVPQFKVWNSLSGPAKQHTAKLSP